MVWGFLFLIINVKTVFGINLKPLCINHPSFQIFYTKCLVVKTASSVFIKIVKQLYEVLQKRKALITLFYVPFFPMIVSKRDFQPVDTQTKLDILLSS